MITPQKLQFSKNLNPVSINIIVNLLTFKKLPNKFDIRPFVVVLYYCVPNMKNYYSIGRLLKNVNVLQVGTAKNPTTPL